MNKPSAVITVREKRKEPSATMSDESETINPLDPFGTMNIMRDASLKNWKTMRDINLETWSKMMIDLVNSDEYSQATSQWLDTYLTMSKPLQHIMDMTMTQALTGLNMPLRSDVTSLAERLTNIEMRLDDQDVKLDNVSSQTEHMTDIQNRLHNQDAKLDQLSSLAGQLTGIEKRLDHQDTKLDTVSGLTEQMSKLEKRLNDQDANLNNILHAIQALSDESQAKDMAIVASTSTKNGARATVPSRSGKTKGTGVTASNASQASKVQKKAKGDD